MGFREGISRILNGSVGFLPPLSVKAANGTWFLRKSGTIMISAPFRLTFFCKTDSSRCSQNPKQYIFVIDLSVKACSPCDNQLDVTPWLRIVWDLLFNWVESKGVFWIRFTSKQFTGKLLRKAAVLLSDIIRGLHSVFSDGLMNVLWQKKYGDHAHENRLDPVSLAIYTFFNVVHTKTKRWHVFSLFQCKKERKNACIFGLLLTNHEGLLTPLSPWINTNTGLSEFTFSVTGCYLYKIAVYANGVIFIYMVKAGERGGDRRGGRATATQERKPQRLFHFNY